MKLGSKHYTVMELKFSLAVVCLWASYMFSPFTTGKQPRSHTSDQKLNAKCEQC